MSLAVLSKLPLLCHTCSGCLFSIANNLASADTCWLCSLHHSQHFWWPSQPSCHPCHYCHWSHFIPEGFGLYLCPDLWSLLWNADGGEVTYPICWPPSTLLLDAPHCYRLLPSCCLMISQRKFMCPSLSSMRTCQCPYLSHHFCLDQTCEQKNAACMGPGRLYTHLSYVRGGFCRQALCQVPMWAWAIMELAVSLGAPVFQWVGVALEQGIHLQSIHCRASCMAVQMHAAHCIAFGNHYKHPKKHCL